MYVFQALSTFINMVISLRLFSPPLGTDMDLLPIASDKSKTPGNTFPIALKFCNPIDSSYGNKERSKRQCKDLYVYVQSRKIIPYGIYFVVRFLGSLFVQCTSEFAGKLCPLDY